MCVCACVCVCARVSCANNTVKCIFASQKETVCVCVFVCVCVNVSMRRDNKPRLFIVFVCNWRERVSVETLNRFNLLLDPSEDSPRCFDESHYLCTTHTLFGFCCVWKIWSLSISISHKTHSTAIIFTKIVCSLLLLKFVCWSGCKRYSLTNCFRQLENVCWNQQFGLALRDWIGGDIFQSSKNLKIDWNLWTLTFNNFVPVVLQILPWADGGSLYKTPPWKTQLKS